MDELEISGKRYISTKRAGKDHKYHADYIGQLIRAKKVAGQKVGRAWYVDAASLAEYLDKESAPRAPFATVAPVVKVIAKRAPAEPVFEEEVVEEIEEEAETQEEEVEEIVEETITETKIETTPIYRTTREAREARSGLRYIADEGPLLPRVQKQIIKEQPRVIAREIEREENTIAIRHVAAAPIVTKIREIEPAFVAPQRILEEEREQIIERPLYRDVVGKTKNNYAPMVVRIGAVVAVGMIVFVVAAFAATHLLFTVTVDGGQSASAGYSVK